MGGGRRQLGDALDHSTGIEMQARLGDRIEAGQPLACIFAPPAVLEEGRTKFLQAISITDSPPQVGPLILDRIA